MSDGYVGKVYPMAPLGKRKAKVIGQINDGTEGIGGVDVKLVNDAGATVKSAKTDNQGFYYFDCEFGTDQPTDFAVSFEDTPITIGVKNWELLEGKGKRLHFRLAPGEVKLLDPVSYHLEPHIIERTIRIYGRVAEGILVEVRKPGAPGALNSVRTDRNGVARLVLDKSGTYEVRIYPDPQALGDPLVEAVKVNSTNSKTVDLAPRPLGAQGGLPARQSSSSPPPPINVIDSFPVLTEEVGYPPSPLARRSGAPTVLPGATLGQTALKAISDVLGWQVKLDAKGFLGALNASFALKQIQGHTEAVWTPRTYAVQTDLSGGITGAQASIYKRAKDALEQSLPLLDGLYPLFKEAKDEDVAAVRATVRSQFADLVGELGLLGGPRVARVTQLFFLMLGQRFSQDPTNPQVPKVVTDPDQISGSLGTLRNEFGFSLSDDQVNTVEDEQDVTNFRILSDYLTSLAQSWLNNLQFFGLAATATPFFGTQLVLLSRQLSVVAESVNEVRFTLDSVFVGPAERQSLQINFGAGTQPMILEDLLTWIDTFASEEGPRLIQEGGKFAVGRSFVPTALQLLQLVQSRPKPSPPNTPIPGLPPGYATDRVQNSLENLVSTLQQLVNLAARIDHVITPEPEPALAVLAISPNAVPSSAIASSTLPLTIIGIGFDVGGGAQQTGLSLSNPKVTITLAPNILLFDGQPAILSNNLLFVAMTTAGLAVGSNETTVTVTNRTGESASLITDLVILPP
jgi:hypothetical protein